MAFVSIVNKVQVYPRNTIDHLVPSANFRQIFVVRE
ncbi:hypothetical protein L3Y34_006616 [Caenorhabditis briggsae]|uniref:Uncharacterized protein n=1 Tax=Caenorhabditis briggsae TaxID=6238 RepID=A0AAE9CZR8_CAEBR|nr:hypothetical protein L3Y34_006616 [Caenorhabditis briggsae]